MQITVGYSKERQPWYAKAFNPEEARDTHGRWTAGGLTHRKKNAEVARQLVEAKGHKATVYADPKSSYAAAYKDGVIHINAGHKFWMDPVGRSKAQEASRFFSSGDAEHVINHEIGHALYDPPDNFFTLSHQDTARAEVSRYAAMNAKEFVSEVHAGMQGDKTYSPTVMQMFSDYARPRLVKSHQVVKSTNRIEKRTAAEQRALEQILSDQAKAGRLIKQAFLDAVNALGDQIDVERLIRLLNQGRVDQAIAIVDAQTLAQGWAPVASAISTSALLAGQSAARAANEFGTITFSFGPTNPQTIEYLRSYELSRLRGLTQDALESVRRVIADGIRAGRNPIDIAREVREFIGLVPSQTQAVLNYRGYLENLDSAALNRALRDARFDPTIEAAITSGKPLTQEQVDRMVARYTARYLKYRSEVIARTEAIRAVSIGNHQLWKQTVADGKVRADQITRTWIYTHDSKVRDAHRLIPSMNPQGVGLDQPFDSILGPIMFPGDPAADIANTANCRCTVFTKFRADASNTP